ncbi:MAG TPA: transposase, partial [Desulfosarcina sp.]|nr:transposase [Desulfosarcina sp.]
IHIVASIPPSLAISDFVSRIKGSSSHHVNHELSPHSSHFTWQESYSVFSLGGKQLDDAVRYVNQQKQHHQSGTTIPSLEKLD